MILPVINKEGKETGRNVTFDDSLIQVEEGNHLVYLDVKQYLANQRQGTHKVKTRNEVAGSTRKIKKQKGTGGARAGSIKSPTIRGGGTIFGPEPRDYTFKLNKKVKKLAKRAVIAVKASENKLRVLEDISFESPKTKDFSAILSNLSLIDSKSLIITDSKQTNLYLSARNIPNSAVVTVDELATYDLLNADFLIMMESAVETIQNRLK